MSKKLADLLIEEGVIETSDVEKPTPGSIDRDEIEERIRKVRNNEPVSKTVDSWSELWDDVN